MPATAKAALWLDLDIAGLQNQAAVDIFTIDFMSVYADLGPGSPLAVAAIVSQLVAANAMASTLATSWGNLMLTLVPGLAELPAPARQQAVNDGAQQLLAVLADAALEYTPGVGAVTPRRALRSIEGLSPGGAADLAGAASLRGYYSSAAPPGAPADLAAKSAAVAGATEYLNGLIGAAVASGGGYDAVLLEISKALMYANGGLAELV